LKEKSVVVEDEETGENYKKTCCQQAFAEVSVGEDREGNVKKQALFHCFPVLGKTRPGDIPRLFPAFPRSPTRFLALFPRQFLDWPG
jgi:hypothetical protein